MIFLHCAQSTARLTMWTKRLLSSQSVMVCAFPLIFLNRFNLSVSSVLLPVFISLCLSPVTPGQRCPWLFSAVLLCPQCINSPCWVTVFWFLHCNSCLCSVIFRSVVACVFLVPCYSFLLYVPCLFFCSVFWFFCLYISPMDTPGLVYLLKKRNTDFFFWLQKPEWSAFGSSNKRPLSEVPSNRQMIQTVNFLIKKQKHPEPKWRGRNVRYDWGSKLSWWLSSTFEKWLWTAHSAAM